MGHTTVCAVLDNTATVIKCHAISYPHVKAMWERRHFESCSGVGSSPSGDSATSLERKSKSGMIDAKNESTERYPAQGSADCSGLFN